MAFRETINVWAGNAVGVRDPEDPELVTVDWALKDGIEILSVEVVGDSLVSMRLRIPRDVHERNVTHREDI